MYCSNHRRDASQGQLSWECFIGTAALINASFLSLHLPGGAAGVCAGTYKFISSKSEVQGIETMKLKTNRMLNSCGE